MTSLVLAHRGGGEWLVCQAGCDRPAAELLRQRLCSALCDEPPDAGTGMPEAWQAIGVQGVPSLPLDWSRLLALCKQRGDAAIRLLDCSAPAGSADPPGG